jgi:hypothetical protein
MLIHLLVVLLLYGGTAVCRINTLLLDKHLLCAVATDKADRELQLLPIDVPNGDDPLVFATLDVSAVPAARQRYFGEAAKNATARAREH